MTSTPDDRKYTKDHEWALPVGQDRVRIGITDFAQKQLGDIVFVELPEVGRKLDTGEPFGTVESVKSVSELFMPLAGSVAAVNDELTSGGVPEDINHDPYGDGWLIEITITTPSELNGLLTAAQYDAYLNS
ncbi:glycine cleavage system protein GcvH [Kitasatospora sp. NPDC127111]|uniref:glycine cleavage system protein GcvH n=1 Tax=Kitasatospora sp. NPDC127111 TaxID=3345363 RepID=UPI003644EDC0